MKTIKRLIVLTGIVIIAIIALYLIEGYQRKENALKEKPLEDLVEEIRQKENYTYLEELPKKYIDAIISVEDHRFFEHKGIDIIAIIRSLIKDIKEQDFVEGGSTITQQLAKNIYFTQDKKVERKIAEMFMALYLEEKLEKEEILELYLNTSYYGEGYTTPKEASRGYFNKEPKDMTDYELVMLAGIPNAPSVYNPVKSKTLAKKRQEQVLEKMIKYNIITEEEKEEILKEE